MRCKYPNEWILNGIIEVYAQPPPDALLYTPLPKKYVRYLGDGRGCMCREVSGNEISVCLYGGGEYIIYPGGLGQRPLLSEGSLVGVGLDRAGVRGGVGEAEV